MKTNLKLSFLFYLNKQRSKDELAPLYIRIYVDGKRAEFSTPHSVPLSMWDSKSSRVKNIYKYAHIINNFLDKAKSDISHLFVVETTKFGFITSKDLRDLYLNKPKKEDAPKHKTILEAFDYHNLKMLEKVKAGQVVAKTHARYIITRNKVEKFIKKQFKTNDKALPEMRLAFVTEFEHYLLTVERIQSNTAHKYIKNLKKIMNMAVGLDWIPSNPFNHFKCSYTNPEREILNQDELNIIMNKKLHTERLEEVRDVFIFCCYTGFAYADVYQFEKEAVMKGLDGNLWLSTARQKTGTKESVPLLPIPLEIIAKYQEHEYCKKYNKLLPVNSNQRYNSYLKEIVDLCGINKKLTSHIARHTFATTVTLANGVPIETVSRMLGHTNIRTTQIYAKVVEQKVSDDMNVLRAKLSPISDKSLTKIS
ncbi:site-specific integrase [Fluviicola taffensis]|uniref:Integrase family protein n=1 Tax=Fluviicola taffensis (strain DSM 16823 / NCIMB 13979 / RW262) TaxID=755732 RepID=F2IJ81_FLUTR|nr:site-specific integrase [Fluviicola taffensis]AEA44951.1 integrase family protein [Fluviicola taffensis DSM 16823]